MGDEKAYLLSMLKLKNPELCSLSYDNLVRLIAKAQGAAIPFSYLDKHKMARDNIDFLRPLQKLGQKYSILLFDRSILFDDQSGELSILTPLAKTDEEYKRLAKETLKHRIQRKVLSTNEFSDAKLDDKVLQSMGSVDETVRVFNAFNSYLEIEVPKERQHFSKDIRWNLDAIGVDENVADLAEAIVELTPYFQELDISREDVFSDYMKNVSYAMDGMDEFKKGCKSILAIMDAKDLSDGLISNEYKSRFKHNYYSLFNVMDKAKGLNKDIPSIEYTLKQLQRHGKRLVLNDHEGMGRYSVRSVPQSYIEHMRILTGLVGSFTSHRQFARLLTKMTDLDKICAGKDKDHLGLTFPSGDIQGEKGLLPTQAKVLAYVDLVNECMSAESYDYSIFYSGMRKWLDIAKNSKEVTKLGHLMMDTNRSGIKLDMFKMFKPWVRNIDDLETKLPSMMDTLRYCRKVGYSGWSWGSDTIPRNTESIKEFSSDIRDFRRKLSKIHRISMMADKMYNNARFKDNILSELPESKDFNDMKRNIYEMQEYMKKWHEEGHDVPDLLTGGYLPVAHLAKDGGYSEVLFTIDRCINAVDYDVSQDALYFIKESKGIRSYEGNILTCRQYEEIFHKVSDMIVKSHGLGFDPHALRIDENHGDIKHSQFFDNFDVSMELMSNGLIPTEYIMGIYASIDDSRRSVFIDDLALKMESMKEKKQFSLTDEMDMYLFYNFAKGFKRQRELYRFSDMKRACEGYLNGDHLDHYKYNTELKLIEKYGIKD